MMLASRTRTLVRKAAMVASSTTASTVAAPAAATGRRAMGASTRRIHQSFHSMVANRGFSTLPTDESNGDAEAKPQQVPSAAAELVEDDHDSDEEDESLAEAENVAMAFDESETSTSELNKNLKPSEIVDALDRHIVGQPDAKKSVAIAMRNRWRRRQLPEDLRKEVTPRNVLLVGPTG